MGFQDDLGYLNGALSSGYVGSQSQFEQTSRSVFASNNYNPSHAIAARPSTWADFASANTAPVGSTAAEFPEKFDVSLSPPSPLAPVAPPKSTQGDWLGSIGAAVGDLGANAGRGLNVLGNAIPWFMERTNVLGHEMAQSHIPGIEQAGGGIEAGTGAFLTGLKGIADVVGPVLASIPDNFRDGQLNDRMALYRAIITGADPGSLSLGPLGGTAQEASMNWGMYRNILLHSIDPQEKLAAQDKIALLAKTFDLPESVKRQIEANPRANPDQMAAFLDKAPEGRQWSYDPGWAGTITNIAAPLTMFALEVGAGNAAFGALGAAGAASEVPGVARATAAVVKTWTYAARIQRYAVAAGIGQTALTTALDSVAHVFGNQAAVDWFVRVNQEQPISADPSVQLVTAFSVNPFEAVKSLKAGVMPMAHAPGIVIGKALGERFARAYDHVTVTQDIFAKMYGISRDDVPAHWEKWYGGNAAGEAFNEVVQNALKVVIDRAPAEERLAFNAKYAPGSGLYNEMALKQFGQQAVDLIDKEARASQGRGQGLLASRWQVENWGHHQYDAPFDPNVAGKNALDFRTAQMRNAEIRGKLGAVTAYPELLPPQGVELIRERLGDRQSIPIGGLDGLDGINESFPAIAKYKEGLVPAGAKTIDRAAIEQMLQRATDDYAQKAKINPVRATTGTDPILRPNSPTAMQDLAEALGVDRPTADALTTAQHTSGQISLLRAYLLEKGGMDATALPADQVYAKAYDLFDKTTAPWYETGRVVQQAEDESRRILQRIAGWELIHRPEPGLRMQLNEAHQQLGQLRMLMRAASDPIIPFAERVKTATGGVADVARETALREAADRKVAAIETLRELDAIERLPGALTRITPDPLGALMRTRDGGWGWAGSLPRMSDKVFAKLTEAIRKESSGYVRGLTELGEEDVWRAAADSFRPGTNFYESLTKGQRNAVQNVVNGWSGKRTLDEVANAAGQNSEDFLNQMGRLRDARDRLLAGGNRAQTRFALQAQASIKVPVEYVTDADMRAQGIFDDPQGEIAHQENVNQIHAALDHGDLDAMARLGADQRMGFVGLARTLDISMSHLLGNAEAYANEIRQWIGERTVDVPRLVAPASEIDQAILDGNAALVAQLSQDLAAAVKPSAKMLEQAKAAGAEPRLPVSVEPKVVQNVPLAEAQRIARDGAVRQSTALRNEITNLGGDLTGSPSQAILDDPANLLGVRVLSTILHGQLDHPPASLRGVADTLAEIESGHAASQGISPTMLAEAQRVAVALLRDGAADARRAGINAGVLQHGLLRVADEQGQLDLARELLGNPEHFQRGRSPLIVFDPADPGGSLQYGLKKPPSDAILLDLSQVPGLAEELLSGHFQPWQERLWTAQVRHLYNYVFGDLRSTDIAAQARANFTDRLRRLGAEADVADAVWQKWSTASRKSNWPTIEHVPPMGGQPGKWITHMGSKRMYGTARNIPNGALLELAHDAITEKFPNLDPTYRSTLESIPYHNVFRESSSFLRGQLADHYGTLGDAMAGAYGAVAHNVGVTTLYQLIRFTTDLRMSAMHFFESKIMALGRAGLRPGELDGQGILGMTRQALEGADANAMDNTGFGTAQGRFGLAFQTFLKEQMAGSRTALRGIQAENPELLHDALKELGHTDEELKGMLNLMGHNPDQYLREMHDWYTKMLNTSLDGADVGTAIDRAIAEHGSDPAMTEVYGKLKAANEELWADVREPFFGNPDRSRAERLLNNYLLFWPISYQIKAAKWLTRVLYDRAGGLATNAGGAYLLSDMIAKHNQLLANDPAYASFLEKHKTLIFVAQMMLPITWGSMGVSLNPVMRDLFFNRMKSPLDIGPIWTMTHVVPQAAGELYPDVRSFPPVTKLLGIVSGKKPPASSTFPVP